MGGVVTPPLNLTADEVIDLAATLRPRIAKTRDELMFEVTGPRLKPSGLIPYHDDDTVQGIMWDDGLMLVSIALWEMLLAEFGPGPRP